MKKSLTLFLAFLLVLLAVVPSTVNANTTEEVVVAPGRIPPDENGDRIATVHANQFVILQVGWGACSKGLAQAWAKTALVQVQENAQTIVPSAESQQYWNKASSQAGDTSACIIPSDVIWAVYWRYPLGTLSVGDHYYHIDYWNNVIHVDGGDYDNDGKIDIFDAQYKYNLIIHVIP